MPDKNRHKISNSTFNYLKWIVQNMDQNKTDINNYKLKNLNKNIEKINKF